MEKKVDRSNGEERTESLFVCVEVFFCFFLC